MAPLRFLKWFLKKEYFIDVEGDLIEIHEKRVAEKGARKAKLLLWRDVILLLRFSLIRNMSLETTNPFGVAHHNVLISLRNFRRNRTSFFINLISLSIGLTCALLIYTWINNELSIDRFHENKDRIYMVRGLYNFSSGVNTANYLPTPLAEVMAAEFPEIEYATAINPFVDIFGGPGLMSYEKKDVLAQAFFADDQFFKVFSFKQLSGDNRGLMISRSLARKLFNSDTDAVGKVVDWNHRFRVPGPYEITGVFEDVPANSTMQFEIIFRTEKMVEVDRNANAWNGGYAETMLLLREGTNVEEFNRKIAGFLVSKAPNNQGTLTTTRFSDMYLYEGGRIGYVRLFLMVAIFTLAIACINFINLSTAQASRKLKEIGVKKSLGVGQSTLIAQFLTESVMLALISCAIAIGITWLLLPNFSLLTGKHLVFDLNFNLIIPVVIVGIVAGFYPACFLSSFKPAAILKGKIVNSSFGESFVRKGLVILQFTISIIFIVAFMIVNQQINFLQTRDLGYNKENVIRFERKGVFEFKSFEPFFNEIKNIPGVVNASGMSGSILDRDRAFHNGYSWDGAPADAESFLIPSPYVAADYIETLGIEVKEGRTFSKDLADEDKKIIVNEAAVKMMGYKDPIGKLVHWGDARLEIIGVVKDFKYGSLHTETGPAFFMYTNWRGDVVVRIQPGNSQRTLEQLQAVYQKFHLGYPFEFTFLSDDYNQLYASENRVSQLSTYFAIVATLISCLGLFGLAVFSSERRTKEIGIRKVLGASTIGIVRLLGSNIVKPVLIAVLIAVPLSYIASKSWLSEFAYRIELSWLFFIAASLLALVVTIVTVGLQTLKAATSNPVDSLRSE